MTPSRRRSRPRGAFGGYGGSGDCEGFNSETGVAVYGECDSSFRSCLLNSVALDLVGSRGYQMRRLATAASNQRDLVLAYYRQRDHHDSTPASGQIDLASEF